MRTLEEWLSLYDQNHRDSFNIKVHKVFIPIVLFCVLGILWSIRIPIPGEGEIRLILIALISLFYFYKKLGDKPFIVMAVALSVIVAFVAFLDSYIPVYQLSILGIIIARVFQYFGHRIEGNKISFKENFKLHFIAPLWLLRRFLN